MSKLRLILRVKGCVPGFTLVIHLVSLRLIGQFFGLRVLDRCCAMVPLEYFVSLFVFKIQLGDEQVGRV